MTNPNLSGVRACVFDAYGTLFDVNSAAQQAQNMLHENWQQLAEVPNSYSTLGCAV
jgi:2-haloacid dehalogenase